MTDVAAIPGIFGVGRGRTLGRAVEDTARLIEYANVFRSMTRRMLSDAGIAPGMRVLSLESGVGDVALLAADLVGPGGEVVGIHKDPAMLDVTLRAPGRPCSDAPTSRSWEVMWHRSISRARSICLWAGLC
jgi:hypothetical protein